MKNNRVTSKQVGYSKLVRASMEWVVPFRVALLLMIPTLSMFQGCGGGSTAGSSGPFTISASVSGLAGTGLVLLDNAGDQLPVNANGTFSFGTQIPAGGSYDVSIFIEPVSPVQFCVVQNGTGTAEAKVASIQVKCTTPIKKTLYNFGAAPDGSSPRSTLMFDKSGNIYGTTLAGGAYGLGTVYKLTPSGGQWVETILYSFCKLQNCADGAQPSSGIVFDGEGNIYGTTLTGGAYGNNHTSSLGGTVFELSPNGDGTWSESVLHSFGNGNDGSNPMLTALVFDQAGNLYGTTSAGGMSDPAVCNGCGTVFKLAPAGGSTWNESVIYQFCTNSGCSDGAMPYGGVVTDSAGNLYGTTYAGGGPPTASFGTVFELTPNQSGQWDELVLYVFKGVAGDDGANPYAGVIFDQAGNLYGTTVFGFQSLSQILAVNAGTVFELTPASGGKWTEQVLYGFCRLAPNCADGSAPYGGLVFDTAGNLYGTTNYGGAFGSWGAVFGLTPGFPAEPSGAIWTESPIYSFGNPPDGSQVYGNLIFDTSGNLYGASGDGGSSGNGTVFEVTP